MDIAANTSGKAIDFYKQALKLDPGASFLFEELTDLYIQSGRLKDAVTEAEDILKREPNNLDARRILGRIYTRMIGEAQQGKINEEMLRAATEQYEKITAKDPKDVESWLTLGRLYRTAHNSVDSREGLFASADARSEQRRCADRPGHCLLRCRRYPQGDRKTAGGN